jgi:hypothetical protein
MPLMLAQPGYFVAISKHFLTPPQKKEDFPGLFLVYLIRVLRRIYITASSLFPVTMPLAVCDHSSG